MISVNYVLNDKPLSAKDKLAINILDDLLVGTSAAILRKTLTDSGLGSSVIGGGLSDELLQATWSIGLKGVAPEKVGNTDRVYYLVHAAILRKTLTDSGLGSSVIGGGLSDELLQATWSIGLKGVAPEKVREKYRCCVSVV